MAERENAIALPDAFDRALDAMKGRPDTVGTKPSTLRVMPTLAIGGSQTFIVQTYRYTPIRTSPEESPGRSHDTIFLEVYGADGQHRLALPSDVADTIARQRDALTGRTRSRAAKKQAEERAARGERPAFLRRKRKGA